MGYTIKKGMNILKTNVLDVSGKQRNYPKKKVKIQGYQVLSNLKQSVTVE